jgi:Ser/Thr protein kinase RdoA (MazF antagonist)
VSEAPGASRPHDDDGPSTGTGAARLPPTPAAYAALGPQQVLDALQAVGLAGDGRVLQLNSYENRVFQVFLEDGSAVVAKCYRPGRWSDAQILEEHAFALELAAAEVPVLAPQVLQHDATGDRLGLTLHGQPPTLAAWRADDTRHRIAASPRCAGREPELDDPAVLRQIGRFIGRLHAVGRQRPFNHRVRLDPAVDGPRALALLRAGGVLTPAELPAWQDAAQLAVDAVVAAFDRLQRQGGLPTLRLHGDCHPGNVLWRHHTSAEGHAPGPHLVDLDDAVQGPAVQDLWMLVSGDAASTQRQWRTLLEGYEQFNDFDDRELALVEPLRTLRMLRHSAWLAERWSDPTFPLNFPFFGTAAYWSQQTTLLREQLVLMDAGGA